MGRPSEYTKEIASLMCERIANGESVRSICRDDDMPVMSTFFRWIGANEEFRKQYAIAKDQCVEVYFEELVDIADNQVSNTVEDEDGKIYETKDNVAVNHAKLRIDTRKWALSKMCPKKYGDKVQTEHDISDPMKALLQKISGNTISPE